MYKMRVYKIKPIQERFWEKVEIIPFHSCWEWTGTRSRYGDFCIKKNKNISAHRFSWQIHFGAIPKGIFVCHKCDNTHCVRPEHLFLGTAQDNVNDALKKGRNVFGERVSQHKVNSAQVRQIRSLYANKEITCEFLGNKFGVTKSTISRIVLRKTWKHI